MFKALKNVNINGIDYIPGDIIEVDSVELRLIRAKKVQEIESLKEVVETKETTVVLNDDSSNVVVDKVEVQETAKETKKAKK